MSLYEKIKPLFFEISLLLLVSPFCLASPAGPLLEGTIEDQGTQVVVSTILPASVFSPSQCSYYAPFEGWSVQTWRIRSAETDQEVASWVVGQSMFLFSPDFPKTYTVNLLASGEPTSLGIPTGQYYVSIDGVNPLNSQICQIGLYGYFPFNYNASTDTFEGATPPAQNGVCGADQGLTLPDPPENLCTTGNPSGISLIAEGGSGAWSWLCYGENGGSDASCSAPYGYPPLPTTEDCSSLTGVEYYTCNIMNSIGGFFLPSQEKIEEVASTFDQIGDRFPFNFLTGAKDAVEGIEVAPAGLAFEVMGNTGTITEESIDFIAGPIKIFSSILVVLLFLFWAREYIKHFFR